MRRVEIEEFLGLLQEGRRAFDVRTPAEYTKGHIPGVLNLPLFSDEERVVVGTLYKQEGRHRAIREGLGFVGPRMRELVEAVEAEVGGLSEAVEEAPEVLVHCWRGGMRSGSVAWLLETYGFRVVTLSGGYKSYRRWAIEQMDAPPPLLVIGGATGVGKTEVLESLREQGEVVIDFEGLANHRGSAFGALLLEEQPSQEHFENLLGWELSAAKAAGGPVWVEDESRMIGMRHLPNSVMEAKNGAPLFVVEAPMEDRLRRLVEVYGDADRGELAAAFERISRSLGGLRTKEALGALEQGDLAGAAERALQYYDKAYAKGIARRDEALVRVVDVQGSPPEVARRLIELREELG